MKNKQHGWFCLEEEDHINKLPDELLLLILNKLLDANCLCRCYLVSKRFSSLVSNVHSVYLTIPYGNTSYYNYKNHPRYFPTKIFSFFIDNFFSKPLRYLNQISNRQNCPNRFPFNIVSFRSAIEFLKKLEAIRNLQVEIPPFSRGDSILKWHGEFGNKSNFLIILFATSFYKECSKESEVITNMEWLTLTDELQKSRIETASRMFMEASWRHHILTHLVDDHKKLENAVMTDLSKQGSVRLGIKQILDVHEGSHITRPFSGYMKLLHSPILQLPLSGYMMEAATVILIRPLDQQDGQVECDEFFYSLMKRAFEDEELVFREAIKLLYENNENNILTSELNLN